MKTTGILNVSSILFESNDSEVVVQGEISAGSLRYHSELVVTHSQLNKILCLLQGQNANLDLDNFFEVTPLFDGQYLYRALCHSIENPSISLTQIDEQAVLKQIRA